MQHGWEIYLFSALLCFMTSVGQNATTEGKLEESGVCPSAFENLYFLGNRNCCADAYKTFRLGYNGLDGHSLAFVLEKLRAWNCSEFRKSCRYRTFAFNEFASLMYDRFCNYTSYESKCASTFADAGNYTDIFAVVDSPCLQVRSYETGKKYAEIIRTFVPFCGTVWCGFDEEMMIDLGYSAWECYPSACRAGTIGMMILNGILSLVTTVANATIVAVIVRSSKTGGHIKYRLSLAISDLLVGIVVFPSFVASLYLNNIGPLSRLQELPYTETRTILTDMRLSSGTSLGYLGFVGFVTSLSLTVSVYTLMLATIDRFKIITDPMNFAGERSERMARWSIGGSWILAGILAALPVGVPGVEPYVITVGGLFVGVKTYVGIILYVVTLGIPLLIVWGFSIATIWSAKKQARIRNAMMSTRSAATRTTSDRRLNQTLWMMVFAFTVSILPAIIVSLLADVLNVGFNEDKSINTHGAFVIGCLEVVAAILLMCNSLWNCFIYSLRNKDFRDEVVKLYTSLTCCSCCHVAVRKGRRRLSSTLNSLSSKKSITASTTLSENVSNLTSAPARGNRSSVV